ncbi:MAG: hypothetical protein NE334_20415 [Lentisphaeraceae bacterium]|nr:hypothetical protein [Lentisphaeraceae bacterium]
MGRLSRSIFKPRANENGVYLHVYNHCVEGPNRDFPFDDVEKEKFLRHLKRTLTMYSIECLSAVVMSNHYHCNRQFWTIPSLGDLGDVEIILEYFLSVTSNDQGASTRGRRSH